MKIKVKEYSDEKEDYIYEEREVVARYKYIKDGDELSYMKDKIYNCVGYDEDDMLVIVDETGEAYLYSKDDFELVTEMK